MDDDTIDLSHYTLCISGVSYEFYGEFDTCTSTSTAANDLLGPDESWAVDSLDGIYDDYFTYYSNPNSVDLYIFDTGIRGTHEQFSSRVIDLGLYNATSFYPSSFWPAFHGTSSASCAGSDDYGSSRGQTIYNINMADNSGTLLFPSITFTLMGLSDSYNNMVNRNKKGVINMSFSIGGSVSQIAMFEDLLKQINDFGSIIVASAGNGGITNCVYPANSEYTISVGAYDESLEIAEFSQYGECVDVYGPGVSILAADSSGDSDYLFTSGTSFSGPYIAGIIANWFAECEDTGYYEPCKLDNIKERLKGPPSTDITSLIGRCDDPVCNGVVYDCEEFFYPRPVSKCSGSNGCSKSESGACRVYNSPICSQCENNYFKISNNHPCVSCEEVLGSNCLVCSDYNGCTQCTTNDFTLVKDRNTGLGICKPSPCLNDDNNCRVCNNGECSQCQDGYSLNSDKKACS